MGFTAIAQGVGMSFLERAYRMTGSVKYRDAALRALIPLETKPIRSDIRDSVFFEEYPAEQNHVLNGFMFTLIGLHDLASIAPLSGASGMLSRIGDIAREPVAVGFERSAAYDLEEHGSEQDIHPDRCVFATERWIRSRLRPSSALTRRWTAAI